LKGKGASKESGRWKVLIVEAAPGFGGSTIGLVQLLRELDRSKFEPVAIVSHPDAVGYVRRRLPDFQALIQFDVIGWALEKPYQRWVKRILSCLGRVGQKIAAVFATISNLSIPMWARAFKIAKIARRVGADVILINNGIQLTVPAIVAAKLASVPCLSFIRGPARMCFVNKIVAKMVDLYISVSNAAAEPIRALGVPNEKIRVAYNGVELDFFVPKEKEAARQALSLPIDRPIFGIVGILVPRKAQDVFLRAAKLVFESFPHSLALIVGDPLENSLDYRDMLYRLCEELGIKDKVKFMPHTDDTPTVYAALDVAVLASWSEVFGRVVIEAMAMERPVVGTDVEGVPEIIVDEQTGFLFKPGDVEGLAEAIKKLLADPELAERMGKAGRARVEENFTIQKQVRKVEEILLHLLEGDIKAQ